MASDDQTNPYARPSHWPTLPTGTMRLGPLPKAGAVQPEPASARIREPVTFEPEPTDPMPATTPAPTAGPYAFFGPTSRSTHPAAPSPVEALARTPEVTPEPTPPAPQAPPAPEFRAEPPPADIGEFGDLDLAIPAPASEALVVPIAARRAKARPKKSPLIPILAASAVGVVGVGVLVLLMNTGQKAAPPPAATLPYATPPAGPEPEASAPPVETPLAAPPPAQVATSALPAAPAAQPAPPAKPAQQRVAAAVRAPAAPRVAIAPPQPYVLEVPPPEAEPTRITIPPPEPTPAPPPPVPRAAPPGPDQPMATHPPD